MKSGITLLVTCLLVIGLPALATDADGDGYHVGTTGTPGGDCNDNDATTYPGATEINDGKDNDCDFLIDENNTPPIANPDFVSVSDLISPITINVLANDGDPTPTTAPLIVSIVGPTPLATRRSDTDQYPPDSGRSPTPMQRSARP